MTQRQDETATQLAGDSTARLKDRLAAWERESQMKSPQWLIDAAPGAIASLRAEIERRERSLTPPLGATDRRR